MDNESDIPFEEAERLRDEPAPSRQLESRVVAALRADGLIRTGVSWPLPARIAAALLLFVLGALAGRYVPRELTNVPASTPVQPRYLLLLAGDVTPTLDGSTRAAEYGDWARSLSARGIKVSGDELATQAELVTNRRSSTLRDLALVGGYFLIEARDDAEAAALAHTCPHIKYGGSIVVRRIQMAR